MLRQHLRVSSGWDQQNLLGPNRPRFGSANKRLCASLVCKKNTGPHLRATQLSHLYSLSLSRPLYPGTRQLTHLQCVNSTGQSAREPGRWGYSIFPVWCNIEGSAPPIKVGVLCMGEKLSTGTLVAVSSALSLELQTPVSTHPILYCSALPTLELKVSDYKGDFVHYCFWFCALYRRVRLYI